MQNENVCSETPCLQTTLLCTALKSRSLQLFYSSAGYSTRDSQKRYRARSLPVALAREWKQTHKLA